MNIEITAEEVFKLMQQLYPDQTARVIAELKAMKYEEKLQELEAKDDSA
ncbi:MAG: hypothetical protein LC650_01555 [Actinobacteria bacterium]|nr:hypothetical protein [Actinomycetota bacterium]